MHATLLGGIVVLERPVVTVLSRRVSPHAATTAVTTSSIVAHRGTLMAPGCPTRRRGNQHPPDGFRGTRGCPAGTKIAFVSDRDVNYEIYVRPAQPSQLRLGLDEIRITTHPGSDFDPDWQPVGRPTRPSPPAGPTRPVAPPVAPVAGRPTFVG